MDRFDRYMENKRNEILSIKQNVSLAQVIKTNIKITNNFSDHELMLYNREDSELRTGILPEIRIHMSHLMPRDSVYKKLIELNDDFGPNAKGEGHYPHEVLHNQIVRGVTIEKTEELMKKITKRTMKRTEYMHILNTPKEKLIDGFLIEEGLYEVAFS